MILSTDYNENVALAEELLGYGKSFALRRTLSRRDSGLRRVIRFAGEETLSKETTVHWGEVTYEGTKAVRDLGIKSLAGYFVIEGGKPIVSYFYPKDLTDYLSQRDFWYDTELDILYCKIDRVLNLHTAKDCIDLLNQMNVTKTRSGFIELMMHEEYFYPDCTLYEPDFEDRVLEPCRWVYEHGYKGIFLDEAR